MFALVDGNTFYASCEAIFRPDLQGKPIVVLSNNDGCIVARNKEAKALGVPDLEPYFMHKDFLSKHGVHVFSSNYALYGDISRRVVDVLSSMVGDVEIYSIDECFLRLLATTHDYQAVGHQLKNAVMQCVGVPNCVGIGPTKTLAKMANRAAKKIPRLDGVCVLDSQLKREWVMKRFGARDIWGIGPRISVRLAAMGIHTALDLSRASPKEMRKHFSVVTERTVLELNGEPCMELEQQPEPKQQIICSRSFSHKIKERVELRQAVSKYAEQASEKLRAQDGLTKLMIVFVHLMKNGHRWGKQRLVKLDNFTNDSRVIVGAAIKAADELFQEGEPHHKAGIILLELIERRPEQLHFFAASQNDQSRKLMASLDSINRRFGADTMHLASRGIVPTWTLARNMLSPAYTTRWTDLPHVLS